MYTNLNYAAYICICLPDTFQQFLQKGAPNITYVYSTADWLQIFIFVAHPDENSSSFLFNIRATVLCKYQTVFELDLPTFIRPHSTPSSSNSTCNKPPAISCESTLLYAMRMLWMSCGRNPLIPLRLSFQTCGGYREHSPEMAKKIATYLSRNNFRALLHRLWHCRTEIIVNVLEFLQQLRQRVRVVRLQHCISRVQLLNVGIVSVQIHGQRVLCGAGLMRLVRQLVVQSTLQMETVNNLLTTFSTLLYTVTAVH